MVFFQDGSSAHDNSRAAVVHLASPIIRASSEARPGSKDWKDVMDDADKPATPNGWPGSIAFRTLAASKLLVEHIVLLLLQHKLRLDSEGCVLLHGGFEVEVTPPQPVLPPAGGGTSRAGSGAPIA